MQKPIRINTGQYFLMKRLDTKGKIKIIINKSYPSCEEQSGAVFIIERYQNSRRDIQANSVQGSVEISGGEHHDLTFGNPGNRKQKLVQKITNIFKE